MRAWVPKGAAAVAAAVGLGGSLYLLALPPDPIAEVVAEGRALYSAHCAACHGANLEGQPDWQVPLASGRMPAPPHDEEGHTWHHSDRDLVAIVKGGLGAVVPGYQSDMPAFEGVLEEEEIASVIEFIKSTWPARERQYQLERTAGDR